MDIESNLAAEKIAEQLKRMRTMERNLPDFLNDSEKDVCPICKGTMWELYEENGVQYYRECSCGLRKKLIKENQLRYADLPEELKEYRLDNFRLDIYREDKSKKLIKSVMEVVEYWISHYDEMKEKGMGFYFYSRTKGSGKTRMIASIANDLLDKDEIVKFASTTQILYEIKASWDKENGFSENELINDLCNTDVLVFDDFGIENQTAQWVGERFYHIINQRYQSKKITIFTSNSLLEELNCDSRITNRIRERTYQIPFPEESIREYIGSDNMRELVEKIRKEV